MGKITVNKFNSWVVQFNPAYITELLYQDFIIVVRHALHPVFSALLIISSILLASDK